MDTLPTAMARDNGRLNDDFRYYWYTLHTGTGSYSPSNLEVGAGKRSSVLCLRMNYRGGLTREQQKWPGPGRWGRSGRGSRRTTGVLVSFKTDQDDSGKRTAGSTSSEVFPAGKWGWEPSGKIGRAHV